MCVCVCVYVCVCVCVMYGVCVCVRPQTLSLPENIIICKCANNKCDFDVVYGCVVT